MKRITTILGIKFRWKPYQTPFGFIWGRWHFYKSPKKRKRA